MGLKHAETLIPLIQGLMNEADLLPSELDLVVCSQGPGSFTGLRIGLSTAKGIAEGAKCPLVSLPTLGIMAEPFHFLNGIVLPVIDAKKQRFYAQLFSSGEAMTDPLDIDPIDLIDQFPKDKKIYIVGPGAYAYRDKINDRIKEFDLCFINPNDTSLGEAMIHLGVKKLKSSGPDEPESGPIYLRPSEAELGAKKRGV